MEIYYATTNKGKVQTMQEVLEEKGITIIQEPIELTESRSYNIKEIAQEKIEQAYAHIKKPTIALDAGFYIDSKGNFPGTFVNFILESLGIKNILKLVQGEKRGCEFKECLSYMDKTLKKPILFTNHHRGTLATEPRGELRDYAWSELWKIFIPEGEEKTLAEMNEEEYDTYKNKRLEKNSVGPQLYEWLKENKKLF